MRSGRSRLLTAERDQRPSNGRWENNRAHRGFAARLPTRDHRHDADDDQEAEEDCPLPERDHRSHHHGGERQPDARASAGSSERRTWSTRHRHDALVDEPKKPLTVTHSGGRQRSDPDGLRPSLSSQTAGSPSSRTRSPRFTSSSARCGTVDHLTDADEEHGTHAEPGDQVERDLRGFGTAV